MNCGNQQPIRPSMGSWITYGLGTENENLPAFVVLARGKPVVGAELLVELVPAGRSTKARPSIRTTSTSTS